MGTADFEKKKDNTRLLNEYMKRIRAIGEKESNVTKNSSEEE